MQEGNRMSRVLARLSTSRFRLNYQNASNWQHAAFLIFLYFIYRACTAKQSSDVNFMPNFTQCIGEQSMRTLSGSKLVADPIPQQLMVASAAQRHRRATTFERSQIKILQFYGGTSRSIKTGNKPVEKTREIHNSSNRI